MNLHIPHVIFAALILVMYVSKRTTWNNRPIWYQPKKIWTSNVGAKGDDSSQQLLDLYTLTHISHGIVFYQFFHSLLGWPPQASLVGAMAVEIAWELIENTPFIIQKYRAF